MDTAENLIPEHLQTGKTEIHEILRKIVATIGGNSHMVDVDTCIVQIPMSKQQLNSMQSNILIVTEQVNNDQIRVPAEFAKIISMAWDEQIIGPVVTAAGFITFKGPVKINGKSHLSSYFITSTDNSLIRTLLFTYEQNKIGFIAGFSASSRIGHTSLWFDGYPDVATDIISNRNHEQLFAAGWSAINAISGKDYRKVNNNVSKRVVSPNSPFSFKD